MKASIALVTVLALTYIVCMVAAALQTAPVNAIGYGLFAVLCWCCGMFEAAADEARRRRQDPAPYWRQA